MIVNPWTVSALSLDIVSVGLGVVAATLALKQLFFSPTRTSVEGLQLAETEDRFYLLFWMGAVFLFLRFLAWPLFYLGLQSIIPEVGGAMCIFGTRNLQPQLTRVIELSKPLLFYVGLVWLLVFRLERFFQQSGTGDQGRKNSLAVLCFCFFAGIVEAFSSVIWWVRSNSELAVSCCTTITDIPSRFTVWIPVSLFGHDNQTLLWWLFYVCNGGLIFTGLFFWIRKKVYPLPLFVFALVNSIVGVFAFIEVLAPRLMHLPFHHCLYCMVQRVMDAPVFVALFITGNMFVGAIYPVRMIAEKWAEPTHLQAITHKMLFLGMLCLAGNIFMISAHLLFD